MKTKVEIEGYEIEIEFEAGVISVKAEFEDEVVEEFTIEVEEGAQGQSQFEDEDEIQGFDEFGQDEEEDFEGGEFEDDEEMEDEEMEGEEAPALESFQSFINKRTKKRK
jgi:hypothetical protein